MGFVLKLNYVLCLVMLHYAGLADACIAFEILSTDVLISYLMQFILISFNSPKIRVDIRLTFSL